MEIAGIFSRLGLDTTPFQRGQRDALASSRRFSRQLATTLTTATTRFAARITGVFSTITRGFARLTRSLLSIRGLLAGAGIFGIVRRARDLDAIQTGFVQLSGSVGQFADVLLRDLRAAVRGTIDDLNLFRITNEAVQLGVFQTKELFLEFVQIGRTLGLALGRDPEEAIERILRATGKLERRLLDEIGIVVSASEAQERYAANLGVTTQSLTDFEKRQAFANEVARVGRLILANLGGETAKVAEAWDRFGASVQNAFSAFSEGLVGPDLANTLSKFLTENIDNIRTFGRFLNELSGIFVNFVQNFFSGLEGQSPDTVLLDFFKLLQQLVLTQIRILIRFIIEEGFRIFGALLGAVVPALAKLIGRVFLNATRIAVRGVVDSVLGLFSSETQKKLGTAFLETVNPAAARAVRIATEAGLDPRSSILAGIDAAFARADKQIEKLPVSLETAIDFTVATFKEAGKSFQEIVKEEYKTAFEALGKNVVFQALGLDKLAGAFQRAAEAALNFSGITQKNVATAFEVFQRANINSVNNLITQLKDSVNELDLAAEQAQFGDDLAFQINEVAKLRDKSIDTARKTFRSLALGGLPGALTLATEAELRQNLVAIEQIQKIRALAEQGISSNFQNAFAGINRQIAEVSNSIGLLSKLPADRFFGELEFEFRELRAGLVGFPQLVGQLDQALKSLGDQQSLLEEFGKLASGVEDLEASVRDSRFGDSISAQIAEIIRQKDLAIEAARKTFVVPTSTPGVIPLLSPQALATNQRALEIISQSAVTARQKIKDLATIELNTLGRELEDVNQEIALLGTQPIDRPLAALQFRFRELRASLAGFPEELAKLDAVLQKLADRQNVEIGVRQFSELVGGVSRSLFEGIADAFVKGEKLSEAWSDITADIFRESMSQVIGDISSRIQSALTKVFQSLGGGAGAAGLAAGLIGIAAGVISQLQGGSDSAIDDFESAIDSSEAFRGVVAGPSNVPIAQIGQQLRDALKTTETLLARIAFAVEGNPGGSGSGIVTGSGVGPGLAVRLSPSTQSF